MRRYRAKEINVIRDEIAHVLVVIFCSSWVAIIVSNKVFDGLWLLFFTFLIGLAVGLIVHKKNKSHPYFSPRDERSFIQKQSPLLFGCFSIIIVGLATLYLPSSETFQIMAHVADKRESYRKGGKSYVLDLGHTTYGMLSITVSKQVWQSQRVGKSILVDVEESIFGQAILIEHEPL